MRHCVLPPPAMMCVHLNVFMCSTEKWGGGGTDSGLKLEVRSIAEVNALPPSLQEAASSTHNKFNKNNIAECRL